jgi:thioredoxin-like negative regulator of GroEL
MLGYSLRMSGDVDGAFDAYWKCLAIDPEHAGAHEYLGEAYLRTGKIEQAKGELAWLEKKGAKEAAILAASIAAWEKANPDAAVKASVTPPALETK